MGNLTGLINQETTKSTFDNKIISEFPRGYAGISGAGEECLRKRQFEHYFVAKGEYDARTARIFQIGHLFEPIFYAEAKELGYKIYGDQTDLSLLGGKLLGHCDGVIEGVVEAPKTPHILELKTLNDKSWKDTAKKGVKASKPIYYSQMQLYMEAFKLTRALFVAINKNDCSYHMERVNKDNHFIEEVLNKTVDVFESEFLLQRISEKRGFYKCGWCTYNDICFNNAPIERTCRSCIASVFEEGMTWSCWRHSKQMDRDEQIEACDDHNLMEMFSQNGVKKKPVKTTEKE